MVRNKPAMSNAERQRLFCERHPHYYRDRHRRLKAEAQGRAALAAPTKARSTPIPPLALPIPEPQQFIELPLFASIQVE